ncbi:MAG: hypothetical protein VB111_09240 [Clostridiaceae bacterium]|nr:hypothetical protein [Clostridiaceae bacterium]
MNYQDTFRDLATIAAPSGFEAPVIEYIETLVRPYAVDIRRDALGNLLVHRLGMGTRVLLSTHVDTAGYIVTFRDEKGFYRFGLLGHTEPSALVGLPVRFQNGARGVIGCDGGVAVKDLQLRHLYIDVTSGNIRIGDACVAALPTYTDGDRIVSPALDGRAGCVAALDVLSRVHDKDTDLYVVFSVLQKVGERGVGAAAFAIEPAVAISLELTEAGDMPESANRSDVKLGGGPALPVRVGSSPANLELLERLESVAAFPVQRTVDLHGQTDLGKLSISRAGVKACVVGIPARKYGSVGVANQKDMAEAADLVLAAL